jgi:GNAT superfamily N-acetyltransferase
MTTVRPATAADADALLALMRGLAEYEKLTPPDEAAAARFRRDLADGGRFGALLAEAGGRPVGYALFFETYSTFRALPKLYLEDVFVTPEGRGTGAGLALFRAVCREALRRGCCALEWAVLDWNQPAITFYERMGAARAGEWLPYALDRDGMEHLAGDTT